MAPQKDEQVGPKPETLLEAKMTKRKLSSFRHIVGWTDSITEAWAGGSRG